MEKERRQGIIFLILGSSMNVLAITQRDPSLKLIFHFSGIAFLVIAIVKFVKTRNANKN
jgi:hypothetical protein